MRALLFGCLVLAGCAHTEALRAACWTGLVGGTVAMLAGDATGVGSVLLSLVPCEAIPGGVTADATE